MAALPARRGCRGSRPRPGSSAWRSCRTPGCWPRRCGPATLDTLEVVRTQALDCRSCRCCGDGEQGHNAFSKANRYNRTRSLAFRFIHTSEDHNLKRLLKLIIDHHGRCRLSHRIISPVTLQVADNPGLEANPVPRAKPGTPPGLRRSAGRRKSDTIRKHRCAERHQAGRQQVTAGPCPAHTPPVTW